MSAEKTGKGKRSQEFLKRIESKVDEGERQLQDFRLRKQIEVLLEVDFTITNDEASPREFMIRLTLTLLSSLTEPSLPSSFEEVAALLKPLKEIKDIVSSSEFNEVVAVRAKDVIEDRRIPMREFQKELHVYLARGESEGQKLQNLEADSRRIFGFAPRPDDDQNRK